MGSEWPTVRLGDTVELKRGYDLPKGLRREGSVPIVSSCGASGHHAEAKVEPPGVVTGRYGTIGRVFYVEEPFWPLNTTLYVRDFKGNDPRFVSYLLETVDYASCADKAAVPGVNRNHLHELKVQLPPLNEQRAIACILGALDDKIELNRRMSRTLDEMAQAMFKSWFLDFEPVTAKTEGVTSGLTNEVAALFPPSLLDSEHGSLPAGWSWRTVADVAALNARTLSARDELDGLRYVEISAVNAGAITEMPRYGRAEAPGRARRRLQHGDTVLSTVRPDRRAYFLAIEPPSDMIASTGFVTMSPTTVPWSLLHAAMTQPSVFERLGTLADGGAYPAVSAATVGDERIAVPSNERIMAAFAQVCDPLYLKSARARSESRVLCCIRDALLPPLLSGEIHVDEGAVVGASQRCSQPI